MSKCLSFVPGPPPAKPPAVGPIVAADGDDVIRAMAVPDVRPVRGGGQLAQPFLRGVGIRGRIVASPRRKCRPFRSLWFFRLGKSPEIPEDVIAPHRSLQLVEPEGIGPQPGILVAERLVSREVGAAHTRITCLVHRVVLAVTVE